MSKAYETALKIVEAEEIAERAESAAPEIKPSTDIISLKDIPVTDNHTILDVQGAGVLEKFLVRSPSSSFGMVLKTEKINLEGEYSDFTDVCAYEESGTYVLELTNIHFQKKCLLVLHVSTPITFSKIFLKYGVV